MDEIDLDNLLEGELSLQNRDIIYNAILNDFPIYFLDYSKKFYFILFHLILLIKIYVLVNRLIR